MLKDEIIKTKTLYSELSSNKKEENEKVKDMLMQTYTKHTKSETLVQLFKSHDNYEIYDTDLCNYPLVCIFKSSVLTEAFKEHQPMGTLTHFENKDRTEIVYPVIIISEELYNTDNKQLMDYIIAHELGHYRKNHVSSIYFDNGDRNILKEIEADLYSCNVIGVEGCVAGMRELAKYLIDNRPSADVDEVLQRLTFVSRKYNISGALHGFMVENKEK